MIRTHSSLRPAIAVALGLAVASPALAQAGQAFPTQPPALGTPKRLVTPPVVTRTLPNGLTLWIVEQAELPIVDAVLVVRHGAEADPKGREGLATLVANLMDEGTATRSSLDIADQAAFLGAGLGTSAGYDASRVSLHTPAAQLDSALALMADVVLRPAFPAPELERLRKERLTSLLQLKDRGPAIADRVYPSLLYGASHPYGRPVTGTEGSTQAITREDVTRFHDTYWRPNEATLVIVGAVKPADIERKVAALFGGWQRKAVPPRSWGTRPVASATTIYLVDKPGAAQSSFRIGSIAAPRATQDYFALQVLNTILGGSFTSRLNNTLREVKGYTYGAGSSFDLRRVAGPFTARSEVVTAKTDSALIEFMKELNAIRAPVPAPELQKAKTYLQLGLPGDFETTGDIASQLTPLATYGLPTTFWNGYQPGVERVTDATLSRVAQRYVDPTKLVIVIVGDRKAIEPGLRALNVAPVVVVDMEGKKAAD